jgi:signal transduction histidine kinase
MSHELRTPLSAILSMSEVMQEQTYGPQNEKQLKCLRTIKESGEHLLALINDILDMSKIGAGKMKLEIDRVVIEPVCQASLRFVEQAAHEKQLTTSLRLDNQVTAIQADERRLKQILVNLLSNAVKFTPKGGAIGLEVVGAVERRAVHFTVWDTGIGIKPEDMEQLFMPFVQLDNSLLPQSTGTGLGLSLVKRLAELHGGSVSVESQVGQGSRFSVSLPWVTPEEQRP